MGKKEHSKGDSKGFVLSSQKDGAVINWDGKAVGRMDWGPGNEDWKFTVGEASLRCLLDIKKSYLLGSWVCKPTIQVKSMGYKYKWSLEEAAASNSFCFKWEFQDFLPLPSTRPPN